MYVHATGRHRTIDDSEAMTPMTTTAIGDRASTRESGVVNVVTGSVLIPTSGWVAERSSSTQDPGKYFSPKNVTTAIAE
jgi:hypothetical protein